MLKNSYASVGLPHTIFLFTFFPINKLTERAPVCLWYAVEQTIFCCYRYHPYILNFNCMFILYMLLKLMIRQNSDRFPKHLCYKNLISFTHWFFPAGLHAAWGAGLRAETPEVHCASRALIIKYLGSVYLAIWYEKRNLQKIKSRWYVCNKN